MTTLVWFRNDLRTRDNPALFDACEDASEPVVAVYLVSDRQHANHHEGTPRLSFVRAHVRALESRLAALNVPLVIAPAPWFADAPAAILKIAAALRARAVYFNAEYPLNEARRDAAVSKACAANGIDCRIRHGDVILPPGSVLKDDGTPYSVFTPFKRRWLDRLTRGDLTPLPEPTARQTRPTRPRALSGREALDNLPEHTSAADWPAGEVAARDRLDRFVDQALSRYRDDRDFPAKPGTSRLSAYLSLGAISVRDCYATARAASGGAGRESWLAELIWREFYRHVLVAWPHVCRGDSFRQELDALPWRHDPEALAAWKAGQTGYPLVDAGMRELAETGFMHNRVRMVTAMFLSKHLLIDWREGERHFMQHLRDADFASNNGGWQWSASTGTDAVPYFRIFNPASQAKKFDPRDDYIRRFVPELTDGSRPYPAPIVDHAAARARALAFFKRG
ncbi:MAG TPA: deoxyribodipyrimidine photo-lyase [Pseudomonadales bacterium]